MSNNEKDDIVQPTEQQDGSKKLSFFELNLKYKNSINTDYTEYDLQKGELSPRLLFRKRKNDDSYIKNSNNNIDQSNNTPKTIANKVKNHFENYLDLVHDSYFAVDKTEAEGDADAQRPATFKFSSLDLLINPLRQKFIFETWSPYDIALFECCVCKFGKNFDLYSRIIKSKSKEDIVNFYYYWKQSKYYRIWKNSRFRKIKPTK
jgi:hypothetical protein